MEYESGDDEFDHERERDVSEDVLEIEEEEEAEKDEKDDTPQERSVVANTSEENDGSSKLLLVDKSLNTICPWYILGSLTFSHKQSSRCTFKLQVSIILHCFYPISNLYELVLCGYSQAAAHQYC